MRGKHYLTTTGEFALEQIPIIGTIAPLPGYVDKLKYPKIKFIVKSVKFMGGPRGYIALNFLEPGEAKKFHIDKGEVFVREDWWNNKAKRLRIIVHETVEIYLRLNFGLTYRQAHIIATKAEHDVIKNRGWELDKPVYHKKIS